MELNYLHALDRIYVPGEGGSLLAEVTWHEEGDACVIDHTFVDGSLRGQGIASILVGMAVSDIRQRGKRAEATCSYARKWLSEHDLSASAEQEG